MKTDVDYLVMNKNVTDKIGMVVDGVEYGKNEAIANEIVKIFKKLKKKFGK